MNTYLNQARELFQLSKEELNKARKLNNMHLARDASGKAWIATTGAFRGFLLLHGLKQNELPKSERQRQGRIVEFGNDKIRVLYYAIRSQVHEDAYYEGRINYQLLFDAFSDVKKFIHHCENGH